MRSILGVPGVLPLFLASCVARLPMGAIGLLLVLHVRDLTGSYASGGLAAGVYALALGGSAPVLARVIDRRGQGAVLRVGAVTSAAAMLALALLPRSAPFAATLIAAAIAGLAEPPTGSCMRSLWPMLLARPEDRHTAYSLEGVAMEIVYISGPLLIVAGIGSLSIPAALAFCAAVVVAGNVTFSLLPPSRRWRPEAGRRAGPAGALGGSGVRVLVAVFLLAGIALGAVEVAVPAALDALGERGLTGVMFGAWGIGSMVGGVAVAHFGPGTDPPRRLAVLLVGWGALHAAVGLAGAPLGFAALLLVAGLTIAPTFVCANNMLDSLAPRGTLTEAFTWTSTGLTAGLATGSTLGGAVAEAVSPGAAMAVMGAGALAAAALVALSAQGPLRAARPAAALRSA